jgi:hypothetical protein
MEVSGQFQAPVALPPGKNLWYPLGRRLGGPQIRSGRGDEDKNSSPCRESNHGHSARSLVIILAEYRDSQQNFSFLIKLRGKR